MQFHIIDLRTSTLVSSYDSYWDAEAELEMGIREGHYNKDDFAVRNDSEWKSCCPYPNRPELW